MSTAGSCNAAGGGRVAALQADEGALPIRAFGPRFANLTLVKAAI
jgi:hypothetical protein